MDITGCSLTELVDDPLIGLVMKSDGVERCELELLLERIACQRFHTTRLAKPCRPQPPSTGTLP